MATFFIKQNVSKQQTFGMGQQLYLRAARQHVLPTGHSVAPPGHITSSET